MKKNLLYLLALLPVLSLFSACGGDDEDDDFARPVIVKDDGTTSNGSTFSAIDDKNFYLDYIKYTVEEGHLVVSGYDKAGFNGVAKIVSGITYKGNTYEVLRIGDIAFEGCKSLTSVTIPNSVTSIGDGAFYDCTGLTSVHISDIRAWFGINFENVTSNPLFYAHHLYINGKEITNLVIPNSVSIIRERALSGCTGLASIKVDAGNPKYDSRNNCNAIIETASNALILGCNNTTIPNSVTSVGNSAFEGCPDLTSVTIPNSVTSIGGSAFSRCTGLTSINIGNSVTSIGGWAFYGCTSLAEVTCKAKTPPTCNNSYSFLSISPDAKLYVPIGSGNAYKSSDWVHCFKQDNIIEKEM